MLTLMTVHTGWSDIKADVTNLLLDKNVATLKAPSAGAMLQLRKPVAAHLADLLAAACVDFSVLPRGYIA